MVVQRGQVGPVSIGASDDSIYSAFGPRLLLLHSFILSPSIPLRILLNLSVLLNLGPRPELARLLVSVGFNFDRRNPLRSRRLPTLSGFCSCGSLNVRYSKRRGLERAWRLIMVRAYRCEDCQKRFFRFTPAVKWASRPWATRQANQLKDKLSTGQAKKESDLWRTLAFEQASREAFDTFAATVEHAVARFNKRFSRSQKIKLEFGRILDGFVLKKEFAPLALAEIRLSPSNETVQFNITRHSSTQVFTKALKFDTSDRICFEQASGLLSVDDAAIALFHYVSDQESNLSRWFDRPNGSKSRAAAN